MDPTLHTRVPVACAAGIAAVLFAIAFHQFQIINVVGGLNDFPGHLDYARNLNNFGDIRSPHFLFQILLDIVQKVANMSYEGAASLLLGASYGAMAWLIANEIFRSAPHVQPVLCVATTVGVLIASHIFLQSATTPNFYYGYVVPISYHNPTQPLMKLLATATLFVYSNRILKQTREPLVPTIALLATGCLLSAIAKPSFLIAFVPAAGIVALWHLVSDDRRRFAIYVMGIGIPATAVLGLQFFWFYVADGSAAGGGIIFAPFALFGGAGTLLPRLPASLFFPAVVLLLALRLGTVTPRLWFAWLLLIIGLAETFLLAESGTRMSHGNFFATGQVVMFLLYVESVLFLVTCDPNRVRLGWAAFVLHVVFGMIFYVAVITVPAIRFS